MRDQQAFPRQESVLIVDDNPINLRLLSHILLAQGYRVRAVTNGAQALQAVQANPPDLILLDVCMPDLNGYQVCERLAANERTRDIPVLFISALDATEDKLRAFAAGGVDYISKPFHAEEVLARVEAHLHIHALRRSLQNEVAELDAFARTVAHDLKNPLSVIIGYADLLTESGDRMAPDDLADALRRIRNLAINAAAIVEELLLLAVVRKKEVEPLPLDMSELVAPALERVRFMALEAHADILLPATWPPVLGYGPWIVEVWTNYLSNGLKYGGDPPRLELGATPQPTGLVRFWVRDSGKGLTPAEQARLFTEFTRLSEIRVEGYGLGLSIVRRIMDKLGGRAGVESEKGQGSTFWFELPGVD